MRFSTTLTAAAAATLCSLPGAAAWGGLGHKTVALLASRYFLPETAVFVREFLYKDQTIMDAATWADRFAHVPLGRFSKTWHYIDAHDNPPDYCQVNYIRDCEKSGCIVSAINNMTERIQDDTLRWYDRSQALKFILHFIGDIHQPLHTENRLRGGNGIHVTFDGHPMNLHSVWDSRVLFKFHGGDTDRHTIALTNILQERIDVGGAYENLRNTWATCLNITDAETCSVSWAQSANDYICTYVLASDPEGKELSGAYAEGALPIIESSIATAAWRLAGWLNTIVTGRDGLDEASLKALKTAGVNGRTEVLTGTGEEMSEEDKWLYANTDEHDDSTDGLRVQGPFAFFGRMLRGIAW